MTHHRSKPRAGSLAYTPRKRAKKQIPRIHSWVKTDELKPLGFAGYKAGMTHVIALDSTEKSRTHGLEISIPVTILETPPMIVAGIRAYIKGYFGARTFTDAWMPEPKKEKRELHKLYKKLHLENKFDEKALTEIENNMDKISDIRLLVFAQSSLTSTPKKKPDLMEIAIGGGIEDKFNYAKEKLGSEININEVFAESSFADVTSVTKGKGFQGIIKRWGVKKQRSKATKKRRHMGSGGAWTPSYKLWREPLPGQVGCHTRTEHNKLILKIGENGTKVTPKGDFLNYGPVKKNYVMLAGSIPGPANRLIRLTLPRRKHKDENFEVIHINTDSKQGA